VIASVPPVIVVTGTDTGVGKTVVTAALCAALLDRGGVAAYKPVQTGVEGLPGAVVRSGPTADMDEVRRLSGLSAVYEGSRLRDPLAPMTAARRQGVDLPSTADHASRIEALAGEHRHVVVEGAGGVLVGLDRDGRTLADMASGLSTDCGFLVVCRSGLGTLNHAKLTVKALQTQGFSVLGLVIGSWPEIPGLADECNITDLPAMTGVRLLGRIPERASALPPLAFQAAASGWFGPPIGSSQL
jgi:dethiobiotin synthetase